MPVTLPNTFATATTITGTNLDANYNALKAKFAAGITDEDINDDAVINAGKIATINALITIPITTRLYLDPTGAAINTSTGMGAVASSVQYSTNDIFGLIPLDSSFAVTTYKFALSEPGAGDAVVELRWGTVTGTSFTNVTTLKTAITLNDHIVTGSTSVSALGGSGTTLAVVCSSGGTANACDAADDYWSLTLELTKTFTSTNTG